MDCKEQCDEIQGYQLGIAWEHFIYDVFAQAAAISAPCSAAGERGDLNSDVQKAEFTLPKSGTYLF